ncbi:MAG TPA: exo-beta-N-acetylmuramidase NamZ domain-containing protein [Bryobacteraceae bacterium]|nr:exo-beta-N-acetylmuramidase NamZ domain-containing protein [Bryobacteraceae bacterium]
MLALGQEKSTTPPALDSALDAAMQTAIRDGMIPGGVLVVGHQGRIVHRKAYGSRAVLPSREPMTLDTIFDIASLTKVVATTPAIMKLFEQGKIRLTDPVTAYLPEFRSGRSEITVRDLMTHFSGLRPDLDLEPVWSGYETGIHRALIDRPAGPPGTRFVYSDINFILLGEMVRRLSGQPLDEFTREHIFEPLGMHETMFRPSASLRARIAPTEVDTATRIPIRGVVHDPTARFMGGVAGHAGVFSTADDLAKYAELLLAGGDVNGVRIFSPLTIQRFSAPNSPPDQPILRGLGWDIDSPYSAPRGELFPIGSYGHTGFTGTSMWLDPASHTYVILLTNSVHLGAGRSINPIRAKVATIAAGAVGRGRATADASSVPRAPYETLEAAGVRRMAAPNHDVLTGLDVLEAGKFAPLQGKRLGLITNQTGLTRAGKRNIDAMREAGVNVAVIFSPEHGIAGKEDRPDIADARDASTGLVIRSLYANGRNRPTREMLRDIDALVFDIQDAGARFYTYSCTMLYALEEASRAKIPFFVLDRPNPVTGAHVEGPGLDANLESFTGCFSMPVRHGLTLGELATMANAERKWNADLHVVKMQNWQRGDWFDSTGLTWIDPSPNLRGLNAASLYDGLALLEAAPNYSVGRGTDAPFEQVGADWIRGAELAQFLNARFIPGVRAYATRFQPASGPFAGRAIEGVRFVILNREQFDSVALGLELAYALHKLYPGRINFEACRFLIGNRETIDALKAGRDPREIEDRASRDARAFEDRRRPYLLY